MSPLCASLLGVLTLAVVGCYVFLQKFHSRYVDESAGRIGVAAGMFLCSLIVLFKRTIANKKFEDIALKKRKQRDSRDHEVLHIPVDPEVENFVCSIADATALVEHFKSGRLSRADAMRVLCHRSYNIGRVKLESVAEELYDSAYRLAIKLDAIGAETESETGIPVSIKDCIDMTGCDSTMGMASRCFKPSVKDGLLVSLLRNGGFIPFVRTNVPQLLLMPESDNRIWGTAVNPYDPLRTPGGSSGGEGSLIAARCSFLGVGTDIGGSIRIPSHYCGIVGFKPTPGRITKKGAACPRLNSRDGQIAIPATAGPMARSVRDCAMMMESFSNMKPEKDCTVPPIPWNRQCLNNGSNKRLRIAMMGSDGWFEPFPACKRAVALAAEALTNAGHQVVPFDLPVNSSHMVQTYIRAMGADGNWYSLIRALEGETLHHSYQVLQRYSEIPNFLRPLIIKILEMFGEKRKALLVDAVRNGGLNVRQYFEVLSDIKAIQNAYDEAFYNNHYDALLMPGLGVTALPHGMAPDLISALSYAFLANVLSWPAGVVPVTTTDESEQVYTAPKDEQDSLFHLASKACIGSQGLPVGVQVMTPKWQDEKCLFVMSEIEKGVQFSVSPKQHMP